ncbi:MAG: HDOD domain-containing protein [Phycisphaerales bacterium]|jgi:signal transduction histidine kinase/HD-like signal output (HDOD) protein|nr:HDOD domain-containing protein [Phycisphaerales bacterium]
MKDASLAERVRKVIGRIDAIPAPQAVALRLFEATSSARTSADEVVAILASDPALAVRVVSLCRRCNHGLSAEVDSLEQAVVLLGFEEIRAAVLSIEICGLLGTRELDGIAIGLRRHAVLTASIARIAAQRLPGLDDIEPSTAFLAGLLHDLGHLVLVTAIPEPMESLAESATLLDSDFNDTLRRVIGVDGDTVGARVARNWHLPGFLEAVVSSAGRGPAGIVDSEHRRLELLVGFADAVARRRGPESIGRRPGVGTIRAYEEALGCSNVDLDSWLPEAVEMATESASMLGLEVESFTRAILHASSERRHDLEGLSDRGDPVAAASPVNSSESAETAWFLNRVAAAESRVEVEAAMLDSALRSDPAASMRIAFRRGDRWIGSRAEGDANLDRTEDPAEWLKKTTGEGDEVPAIVILGVPEDGLMIGLGSKSPPGPSLVMAWKATHQQARRFERLEAAWEEALLAARQEVESARRIARLDADASLAEIAAGAAHEMNNPLTVISGRAQILCGRSGDSFVDAGIEEIAMQTKILSRIVRGLHQHATGAAIAIEATSSRRVLEACAEAARSKISEQARIVVQSEEREVGLCVDVRRIAEIAIEAVRNACEGKEDVCIRIRGSIDSLDGRWSLLVEDDGPGFGHAALEHAFDPFFSQKTAGRRTGLGLTVVRRIAEAHGGSALVHNRTEGGGCLVVSLPIQSPDEMTRTAA